MGEADPTRSHPAPGLWDKAPRGAEAAATGGEGIWRCPKRLAGRPPGGGGIQARLRDE